MSYSRSPYSAYTNPDAAVPNSPKIRLRLELQVRREMNAQNAQDPDMKRGRPRTRSPEIVQVRRRRRRRRWRRSLSDLTDSLQKQRRSPANFHTFTYNNKSSQRPHTSVKENLIRFRSPKTDPTPDPDDFKI